MRSKILLTVFLFLVLLLSSLRSHTQAAEPNVSGNGADSQNSATVNNSNQNKVSQNNSAVVQNNIDAKANTGGNSASGNTNGNVTIKTGDAKVNVKIQNNLNGNSASVDNCCDEKDPAKTPPPAGPGPAPAPSPSPSPTPSPSPSSGPGDGGSQSSGGIGGGEIQGLSATSGEPTAELAFYGSGVACLALGKRFLHR